ncbi:MAG TPA: molecular chaperone HtpG [Alphaproteobacteria bacterium]|nr:molecular chaperone HtpG [Alphaproteobacteria bacterium]
MSEERLSFQAEVSKLLDIVAHSLYSEKEVFLRELISNASDACDRLRYAALTRPELLAGNGEFRITLSLDRQADSLTIADNGIGMSRQELIDNLGTIARSGTAAFVAEARQGGAAAGTSGGEAAGSADRDPLSLIGQFGVGFYSAFMVADRVEVVSRKAGETEAWAWRSDGKGSFTIAEANLDGRGTRITLHLNEAGKAFLDPDRIRQVVKRHSDHIGIPIELEDGGKREKLNQASALWTRPKSEITTLQYNEFYRHVSHSFDDPWLTLHYQAEGTLAYTALLFVPGQRPFDLFHPERKGHLRLYVKRVFITEDAPELLPAYLRFLRGIVDSEDLPLNVSREMLQQNPLLAKIRSGLVKRVLDALAKKATEDAADYKTFWENFGAVLKEGIYEDPEQRERILALARFRSTASDGLVSLATYIERMKEGQAAIYYIAGEAAEAVAKSPQIEGFRAKGVEVLLMTDPVDEFWLGVVGSYQEKPFKSVTRGGADLDKIKGEAPKAKAEAAAGELSGLVALLKLTLKDAVKDVRVSERLTDSPVCLVADEGDMDIHLERLLRQHKQLARETKRILEINPGHALIKRLAADVKAKGSSAALEDYAHLLLDQARIIEGETLADPAAFSRRLSSVLAGTLGA